MIMNDDGKNKDQVYILLSKQKRVRHILRTIEWKLFTKRIWIEILNFNFEF